MNQSNENQFLRFQVYTGAFDANGEVCKEKSIGFALLRKGQEMYSIKLWTFPQEKYYLIPTKDDPSKVLIMTREEKRNQNSNRKYNWSIVGNGAVINEKKITMLAFDLFSQPIFMNLTPDSQINQQSNANLSVA